MTRTVMVPISNNMAELCTVGKGTSSFVVQLWEPFRNVSRVELCSLSITNNNNNSYYYVKVTVPELVGIHEMPVMLRYPGLPSLGFQCNKDWHFYEPQTPIGAVSRLSISISFPPNNTTIVTDDEQQQQQQQSASSTISMLWRITYTPRRQEVVLSSRLMLLPLQTTHTQLVMLTDESSNNNNNDDNKYVLTASLPQPLYEIQHVRLLGFYLDRSQAAMDEEEPCLFVCIDELGIEWPVQMQDRLWWRVDPQYHSATIVPTRTTMASSLTVQLRRLLGSAGTILERSALLPKKSTSCCVLLQITSARVPFGGVNTTTSTAMEIGHSTGSRVVGKPTV